MCVLQCSKSCGLKICCLASTIVASLNSLTKFFMADKTHTAKVAFFGRGERARDRMCTVDKLSGYSSRFI